MPMTSVDPRGGFVKWRREKRLVVALETDAETVEGVPTAVRAAANLSAAGELNGFCSAAVPRGADGVLTWLTGESILSGCTATIRQDLRVSGRCTLVPVHVPCIDEVPFITLQPRWFRSGRPESHWNFRFRIQSSGGASRLLTEALAENAEPWARLAAAVLAERARVGAGTEALVKLCENA